MELAIAERTYSSWSLRGWLLADLAGAPFAVRYAPLRTEAFDALVRDWAPGVTVPMIRFQDGALVWDSLAIAEELHERFPRAGIWPSDPEPRAAARSLAAEMHSGFRALRAACPMNLERAYAGFEPSEEVLADVARIEALWAWARERFGQGGPWLFGRFTAADAFYAPVATRLATYGLGESPAARDFIETLYAHPPFRRWRAMGVAENRRVDLYEMDLPDRGRVGPAPRPARRVEASEGLTPLNAACPYSGKPVAKDSLAEIDGKVVGFCNRFCRDKSVADADAWPKLAELLG